MRETLLERLYKTEITFKSGERRRGKKYNFADSEVSAVINQLKTTLKSEDWKIFLDYEEKSNLLSDYAQEEEFIRGFRLGARLMHEVFSE